jgi:hypothetical protein
MRSPALAMLVLLTTVGCGDVSERASINARLTDGESMFVGIEVSSSATGAELEVDWGAELISFAAQPCPVAVYRWLDSLPEQPLPVFDGVEGWPESWDGGELVESAIILPGEAIELGPTRLDEVMDLRVGGLLGIATCEDSGLDAIVYVEAEADLGVRALSDALVVDIWRAG